MENESRKDKLVPSLGRVLQDMDFILGGTGDT